MQKIHMVDLGTQYQAIKSEIDASIQAVIDHGGFINGPEVKLFADELAAWLGVKHVIPCANGTDAIQIALMALDLEPGDEVVVPAFNYVATAEVVALLKLKPLFVDVLPDTFGLDIEDVKRKITPKTKVIMPVHLFGQCCNMAEVMALAAEKNLYVVEDVAQAIGAKYNYRDAWQTAGGMGHIGTTSFFPSKNLGCYGDGGAIYTNNDELAAKLKMIANHGQKQKYTYEMIGVNSRLDTIQAALLRVKLKNLSDYIASRQKAAANYDEAFKGIEGLEIPTRDSNSTHVFHQYTLRVKGGKREALKQALNEKGIPTMVYYPSPLHLQQAYNYIGHQPGSMPVAEQLCTEVVSLPMHTELSNEQLQHIADAVKEFFA